MRPQKQGGKSSKKKLFLHAFTHRPLNAPKDKPLLLLLLLLWLELIAPFSTRLLVVLVGLGRVRAACAA